VLNSLKTKNFKKLNDHTFNFTSGLNIICGANTAGKTTLTQAIGFALFGVRAVPGKSEKIPTWGHTNCEVVLAVDEYEIIRSLRNCTVSKNGDIKASGNTACSEYIQENITGLDYKAFKLFNWSGPSETAALLTIGATQLQRDIEKFSGVEFIDNIIKTVNKDNLVIKTELDGAELIDLSESDQRLQDFNKRFEVEADILNRFSRSEHELSEALATDEVKLTEQKQSRVRRSELTSIIDSETATIEAFHPEIAELVTELNKAAPAPWSRGDELSEFQAELRTAESVNVLLESKGADLTVAQDNLAECKDEILKDVDRQITIDGLEEIAARANTVYTKANDLLNVKLDRVAELKYAIADGICPNCHRPFEGTDLQDTETELEALNTQLPAFEESNNTSHADWRKAKNNLAAAEPVSSAVLKAEQYRLQVDELLSWITEHRFTDPTDLQSRITNLITERADIASAITARESVKSKYEKLTGKLDIARSKKDEAEHEIKTLPTVEDIDALEQSVKDQTAERSQLQLDIKETERQIENIETALNDTKKYIKESESYNTEVKRLTKESVQLSSFSKFLKESRVTFLASVWQQILSYASGFVNQASGGIVDEIINVDGFEFSEDGVFAPVESASGAQRSFIGVAVRIALSQSLGIGMDTIILDEPTSEMREENAMRLAGSLLSQDQVLFITHRQDDQVAGATIIEL